MSRVESLIKEIYEGGYTLVIEPDQDNEITIAVINRQLGRSTHCHQSLDRDDAVLTGLVVCLNFIQDNENDSE